MKSFKQFISEGPQVGGPGSVGKKPGKGVSRFAVEKIGPSFMVFRVFGEKAFGDEEEVERMPGVFRSKQAANKEAKSIAAKTGESIR